MSIRSGDPGVSLALLRIVPSVSAAVVARIGSVDAAVMLNDGVLEVLPELLHRSVGALVMSWRRRASLVGCVRARCSRSGSG